MAICLRYAFIVIDFINEFFELLYVSSCHKLLIL